MARLKAQLAREQAVCAEVRKSEAGLAQALQVEARKRAELQCGYDQAKQELLKVQQAAADELALLEQNAGTQLHEAEMELKKVCSGWHGRLIVTGAGDKQKQMCSSMRGSARSCGLSII